MSQRDPLRPNFQGLLPQRPSTPPPPPRNASTASPEPPPSQDGARRFLFPTQETAAKQQANRADRLRVLERRIRTTFLRRYPEFDFHFVRILRAGAAGQTWLLRYKTNDFAGGGWARMVLKTPNQNMLRSGVAGGGGGSRRMQSQQPLGFGLRDDPFGPDGGGGGGGEDEGDDEPDDDDFEEDEEEFGDDDSPSRKPDGTFSKRRKNEKRFEKEAQAYRLFQNAPHIVNGIRFDKDPMQDILRTPGSSGWQGPRRGDDWLYLEYMENGSLLTFVDRCVEHNIWQVPNRLLWRFFLCLIRACIGMAYPPDMRLGGNVWETIPPPIPPNGNSPPPEEHVHADMHSANVMITGNTAHDLGIMLKLVDFGAWETMEPGEGPPRNIFDVACLMVELILLIQDGAGKVFQAGSSPTIVHALNNQLLWQGPMMPAMGRIDSYATFLTSNPYTSPLYQPGGLLEDQDPNTHAHRLSTLDPDLKNTLVWCLAANEPQRPALATLLAVATNALDRTDMTYRDWWLRATASGAVQSSPDINADIFRLWCETEGGLQSTLQGIIYDAGTANLDGSGGGGGGGGGGNDNGEGGGAGGGGGSSETPETQQQQQPAPGRQARRGVSIGRFIRRFEQRPQYWSARF